MLLCDHCEDNTTSYKLTLHSTLSFSLVHKALSLLLAVGFQLRVSHSRPNAQGVTFNCEGESFIKKVFVVMFFVESLKLVLKVLIMRLVSFTHNTDCSI